MRDFSQKRDPARLFLKRVGLIILLVAVFLVGSSAYSVYEKEKESRKSRVQAENEYKALLEREARLREDIATLNTARGMEEALREQYALAENDEHLIVIVEPQTASTVEATSTSSFSRWFEALFFWR